MSKRKDLFAGLFLWVVAALAFAGTAAFEWPQDGSLNSASFPRTAAFVLIALGLLLVVRDLLKLRAGKRAAVQSGQPAVSGTEAESEEASETKVKTDWVAPLLSMALLAVYVWLLKPVGFLIMTFVYLFAQTILLAPKDKRRYVKFALISLVATGLIYLVFSVGLEVMLPAGILG